MNSIEKTVRQFHESWDMRDPERGVGVIATDCRFEDVARSEAQIGPEGYRADYYRWRAAFPDGEVKVVNVITGGDGPDGWAVVEFLNRGTQTGTLHSSIGEFPPPVAGWKCVTARPCGCRTARWSRATTTTTAPASRASLAWWIEQTRMDILMHLPDFFDAMPSLDVSSAETVVSTRAVRSEAGLVVFFHFHQDLSLPPHSHGQQWGIVVAGKVALAIDGQTRRHGRGISCDITAGVEHGVTVNAGTIAIDGFAEADRHPLRAH